MRAQPRHLWIKWISILLLMAAEWILLVAGTRPQEMLVGAFSLVLSALFLWSVHRSSDLRLRFEPRDVLVCWRLPWYVVSDVWLVTAILSRDLLGGKPVHSFYRVSGFVTSKDDPTLLARRVLATVCTTASPNSIVIGIDYEQSRMLFHQLERSRLSKMARLLGAR
jgi:hypothetical protein